jgi:hypothetical protein
VLEETWFKFWAKMCQLVASKVTWALKISEVTGAQNGWNFMEGVHGHTKCGLVRDTTSEV